MQFLAYRVLRNVESRGGIRVAMESSAGVVTIAPNQYPDNEKIAEAIFHSIGGTASTVIELEHAAAFSYYTFAAHPHDPDAMLVATAAREYRQKK